MASFEFSDTTGSMDTVGLSGQKETAEPARPAARRFNDLSAVRNYFTRAALAVCT